MASLPPAESSRLLINLANCRGGSDNSTVVVVGIDSYPNTVQENPGEFPETPKLDRTMDIPGKPSGVAQILLAGTAVLCLLAGIVLGVMEKYIPAAILVAASVLSWLISRRMVSIDPVRTVKISRPPNPSFATGHAHRIIINVVGFPAVRSQSGVQSQIALSSRRCNDLGRICVVSG